MGELARREGWPKGQKVKEHVHIGVWDGQTVSSNGGGIEDKDCAAASIPVHAAVAKIIESQRRDVPGPRSLRFSGKCRGGAPGTLARAPGPTPKPTHDRTIATDRMRRPKLTHFPLIRPQLANRNYPSWLSMEGQISNL